MADLLTLLIEDFEEKHYTLKAASPVEVLNELMLANNLKQKDLVDVFGTPSIVSEVLHGKRQLITEHIRRLSRRFHVSPEVFI
jgi:HTH-type transcriptional regulator/antitoxin HigA